MYINYQIRILLNLLIKRKYKYISINKKNGKLKKVANFVILILACRNPISDANIRVIHKKNIKLFLNL